MRDINQGSSKAIDAWSKRRLIRARENARVMTHDFETYSRTGEMNNLLQISLSATAIYWQEPANP